MSIDVTGLFPGCKNACESLNDMIGISLDTNGDLSVGASRGPVGLSTDGIDTDISFSTLGPAGITLGSDGFISGFVGPFDIKIDVQIFVPSGFEEWANDPNTWSRGMSGVDVYDY